MLESFKNNYIRKKGEMLKNIINYNGVGGIWNGKITTIKRKAEMLKNILKLIDEGEI